MMISCNITVLDDKDKRALKKIVGGIDATQSDNKISLIQKNSKITYLDDMSFTTLHILC